MLFIFVLAITLATLGVFLLRDYTRFLSGVYSLPGQVISIQQVFVPRLMNQEGEYTTAYVPDGFYPIIEYQDGTDNVPFTAIDASASGRFHVGDRLKLRVTKSRRKMQRSCRSASLLSLLLFALVGSMAISAMNGGVDLSLFEVIAASFVLTVVATMLIIFSREKEEHGMVNEVGINDPNNAQLHLYEPTAFEKWGSVFLDKRQRDKIRGVKVVGCFCFTSACMLIVLALQPSLLFA